MIIYETIRRRKHLTQFSTNSDAMAINTTIEGLINILMDHSEFASKDHLLDSVLCWVELDCQRFISDQLISSKCGFERRKEKNDYSVFCIQP